MKKYLLTLALTASAAFGIVNREANQANFIDPRSYEQANWGPARNSTSSVDEENLTPQERIDRLRNPLPAAPNSTFNPIRW